MGKGDTSVTDKCDPEYIFELREQFHSIYVGTYMSNKHWNTLTIYRSGLLINFIMELIDHSYDMAVK
ncbi:MmcQ/YjbR family DNA-binding protein [Aestuariivivens marinum]|uniref:MmcQ/YjbR family DNA-binding protein n=1 Tax=Aestuariivivens marinum TaxID=2913555 RepID=UPI00293F51A7|nr:MmcQ/YjbR family DNA-binding protein [Aestuariivivens marinum]